VTVLQREFTAELCLAGPAEAIDHKSFLNLAVSDRWITHSFLQLLEFRSTTREDAGDLSWNIKVTIQ